MAVKRKRLAAHCLLLGVLALPATVLAGWKAVAPGGEPAPPLPVETLEGKEFDLAALRGQVVLLNFWASWCEPCRTEMPALGRLQQQLQGRRLRVLGVNLGEGRARIESFLRQVPLPFAILRDPDSQAARTWQARMLPMTYLLDRQGRIRYRLVGEADWDDATLRAPLLELLDQ